MMLAGQTLAEDAGCKAPKPKRCLLAKPEPQRGMLVRKPEPENEKRQNKRPKGCEEIVMGKPQTPKEEDIVGKP